METNTTEIKEPETGEKKSLSDIFHSVTSSAPVTALRDLMSKAWNKIKELGGKAKEGIHKMTAPKEEKEIEEVVDKRAENLDNELGLTGTGGEVSEPSVNS